MQRRLALLLPGGLWALAAGAWVLFRDPCPVSLRVPSVLLAVTFAALQGYLVVRTVRVVRDRTRLPRQVARTRRREMRPAGLVSIFSLVLLAALVEMPVLFPESTAPQEQGLLGRRKPRVKVESDRTPPPVVAVEPTEVETVAVKEQERPKEPPVTEPPAAAPAPVAAAPEIRPELVLEPTHLAFDEIDPVVAKNPLPPPALPPAAVPEFPGGDDDGSPLRFDRWHLGDRPDRAGWWIGLLVRPLPDEHDPETLPPVEGRVDGFLLLGGGERIPGLTLSLEIPLSRHDLLEVSWTSADLPHADDVDRGLSADWHHATLAYVRRLTGYTSHADFDLAVSFGASMDLFGSVAGIPDPGGTPKVAPYAALDLAFWQQNAVGLLLHLGESFPATLIGSSLGMTDFSAQIRWDLTERISIHGGYRVLLLHYKPDEAPVAAGTDVLHEGLSGPMVGVDIRF
jgi:hypothetical protein